MSENEEKVGFVALGTPSWWSAPTPREQYLESHLAQAEAEINRCKFLLYRALQDGCTRPWRADAQMLLGTWNPYGFGEEGGSRE